MSRPMSLRDEHAAATRDAVVAAARRLFAEGGYAGASIDQIAEAARVTKGAVYHHFADKRAVFRAVYEQLASELDGRVRAAIAGAPAPLARVPLAIEAFFAAAHEPAIRRVMFVDGLAVLGGECREIDARFFLDLLAELIEQLRPGRHAAEERATLARLVLAMLIEAAQILGRAEDLDVTRRTLQAALATLLAGFAA